MENLVVEKKKIFTIIPERFDDKSVYGEKIIRRGGLRLRAWNPYRSKLSAALILGLKIDLRKDSELLYLGAATGTTVSHLSDILHEGKIYAVEISPLSMKKLLELCERRD
ncbi:MAG: fibrillarin-like rRNA/tRNA 2'-O-methyltransferase, partial [Thermoplasmata archaeon]